MKPVWISLTCLTALLTGVFLGRYSSAPPPGTAPAGSAARPGGPGARASHPPVPDLITQFKQTSSQRGKTKLMLEVLATGRSGNIRQLVEAAGNDINQLLMLSYLALPIDPAGFMNAITLNAGLMNERDIIARNFAERWAQTDFEAAFATSRKLPKPIAGWLAGVILESRMATDPTGALKLAVAHPAVRFNWDNQHKIPPTPENVQLVRSLPSSMGKFAMIKALSSNLPLEQALELVYEDRDANPLNGVHRVSETIVRKDPQAAQDWVLANPDHPAASQISRRVGEELIKSNPVAAVEWAAIHLSGPNRTRVLNQAAKALRETDPAAAAAARALLPDAFKPNSKP